MLLEKTLNYSTFLGYNLSLTGREDGKIIKSHIAHIYWVKCKVPFFMKCSVSGQCSQSKNNKNVYNVIQQGVWFLIHYYFF